MRAGLVPYPEGAKRRMKRTVTTENADDADEQVVNRLRVIAASLAGDADDTLRQVGGIIARFASVDGCELRSWMVKFRGQQAAARALEDSAQSSSESAEQWQLRLEAPPNDGVVRDEGGSPALVDVVAYLDSLAYWVASRRLPKDWQRPDSEFLATVAAKSKELADLLERAHGPLWRGAIELFDEGARPILGTEGNLSTFRRDVSARLRRQTLSGLLMNLVAETDRLGRLSQLDSAVRYTSRPRAAGAWDRLLAREIRDWFSIKCQSPVSPEVIADIINLSRTVALRAASHDATGAQVKEWLRAPRNSSKKP